MKPDILSVKTENSQKLGGYLSMDHCYFYGEVDNHSWTLINSIQQFNISLWTDMYKKGEEKSCGSGENSSSGINSICWPSLTLVSDTHRPFIWTLPSLHLSSRVPSEVPSAIPVLKGVRLFWVWKALRSVLQCSTRRGRCSVEGADGSETDVTVFVTRGPHASHRQVKLPIWTHTHFIESLWAASRSPRPRNQRG